MSVHKEGIVKKIIIAMDAGGTTIKVAALDKDGVFLTNIETHPSHAKKSYDTILEHFINLIQYTYKKVDDADLVGLVIGFPGPFDYEKGISYIKGIDKYDSMYQKNFKDDLQRKLNETPLISKSKTFKISFANDALLFALGAYRKLNAKVRMMTITIGTGCGSTFIDADNIVAGKDGVPSDGMIYHLPYRDSIIDDYISKRGIERFAKLHGYTDVDVADLNKIASKGNQTAIELFQAFGIEIHEALKQTILSYKPKVIVFGGQISKAFEHFGKPIAELAEENDIKIIVDTDSSRNVMIGAVGLINWIEICKT